MQLAGQARKHGRRYRAGGLGADEVGHNDDLRVGELRARRAKLAGRGDPADHNHGWDGEGGEATERRCERRG